ncbi:MAG: penicillin acylase family protein, partial [Chloroflexi bacterium]
MNLFRFLFRLLMGRRLPTTSGALEVPGVTERVRIRRDRYGIPYIEATNDQDAWYALGFCQGQDRTFQLEGLLRVVRGTLSELVGPTGLPVDRLSRRIGFYRTAQEQMAHLDDEVRAMLEAYARGVSDGARLG